MDAYTIHAQVFIASITLSDSILMISRLTPDFSAANFTYFFPGLVSQTKENMLLSRFHSPYNVHKVLNRLLHLKEGMIQLILKNSAEL